MRVQRYIKINWYIKTQTIYLYNEFEQNKLILNISRNWVDLSPLFHYTMNFILIFFLVFICRYHFKYFNNIKRLFLSLINHTIDNFNQKSIIFVISFYILYFSILKFITYVFFAEHKIYIKYCNILEFWHFLVYEW